MNWHRALSALVAATYVILAWESRGGPAAFVYFTKLLIPLACIWFPEELGQYTGTARMSQQSPARLVRFVGWALLLMPVWLYLLRPLCDYQSRN